jgi:CMP-N,N'-diacetyllegionaminic acid synthase
MKILGIIPARGGSKGVPRKNIRLVAGKPLIAYTIEAAKGSRMLTRFVTSTDDAEIAEVVKSWGSEVLMRPVELAEDDTPMVPVVRNVLRTMLAMDGAYDYVVILQPVAPLRTYQHIDDALALLEQPGVDSVVSISPVPGHYSPHWQFTREGGFLHLFTGQPLHDIIKRRQDLPPTYTRNGAIYACKTSLVLESGDLYGANCMGFLMPEAESVNIDSEEDLLLAERLLLKRDSSMGGTQ